MQLKAARRELSIAKKEAQQAAGRAEAAEKYAALAEKYGITPCELALCWARDRWFNACIISGTCSLKQVEETVAAFKIDKLPEALLKEIDVVHEQYRSPCNFFADKPTCVEAPWLTK
jgi:aryl-alcohol dehydrogenase-like predicted oxidoreductase